MSEPVGKEAFMVDVIKAINGVADDHDAADVETRALVAALGQHADEGKWFNLGGDE